MKLIQLDYHRNGVSGAPFHGVIFEAKVDGQTAPSRFLATVFEEPAHVAVICLDRLEAWGVSFGANSWRGDLYERQLRQWIKESHE